MTNIFIFNNASRAAEYGIGTYIRQLTSCLQSLPDTKVSLVEMYTDTKELSISEDENGICHFLIPSLDSLSPNLSFMASTKSSKEIPPFFSASGVSKSAMS